MTVSAEGASRLSLTGARATAVSTCGLIICALMAHLLSPRPAERRTAGFELTPAGAGTASGEAYPNLRAAVSGTLFALLFLFGTVSSSMADRYMPAEEDSYRILSWVLHTVQKPDGNCPRFAPGGTCSKDVDQTWRTMIR